jgi:hypothetical protein
MMTDDHRQVETRGCVPGRLTPTPEALRSDPGSGTLNHAHPRATAFAVLRGSVVALALRSTHNIIFAALRIVGRPEAGLLATPSRLTNAETERMYGYFGVTFHPQLPSGEDLAWFEEHSVRKLAQDRALTQAGRVWTNVNIHGQSVSVLSFWAPRQAVPASTIALVVRALGVAGPVLVEFRDSNSPESETI